MNRITSAVGVLAGLGSALLAVAVAAPAAAATPPVTPAGSHGVSCTPWVELDIPPNDREHSEGARAHATCSAIPVGIQVRVKLNVPAAVDQHSEWFTATDAQMTTPWGSGPREMDSTAEIELRADPSGAGSECYARIEKKDVFLGRDEFRVGLRCPVVAPGVKVRGVGDFAAQLDTHTPWLVSGVEDGWHWSGFQTPSTLTDPIARLDFALE